MSLGPTTPDQDVLLGDRKHGSWSLSQGSVPPYWEPGCPLCDETSYAIGPTSQTSESDVVRTVPTLGYRSVRGCVYVRAWGELTWFTQDTKRKDGASLQDKEPRRRERGNPKTDRTDVGSFGSWSAGTLNLPPCPWLARGPRSSGWNLSKKKKKLNPDLPHPGPATTLGHPGSTPRPSVRLYPFKSQSKTAINYKTSST